MNQIEVYAEGTNHLGIDITGIGPREKTPVRYITAESDRTRHRIWRYDD